MSQTTTANDDLDLYLIKQRAPVNKLEVDPQWHNVRLMTPIGRFQYVHVAAPFQLTQKDGTKGKLQYSATMFWWAGSPENPLLADLGKAINMVADAHWPAVRIPDPNNPSQIVTVPGSYLFNVDPDAGGLHYPLRSGDKAYARAPDKLGFLRGMWSINTTLPPETKKGTPQRPLTVDRNNFDLDGTRFYPGCYGMMDVTCIPFDNAKRGVTFRLNGVKFYRDGTAISTFNAGDRTRQGFAAIGDIEVDPYSEPGFGPNSAPGNVPPGVAAPAAPAGFAAPPSQQQQPGSSFAPSGPVPPNQNPAGAWAPQVPAGSPAGFARPPGI